MKLTIRAGMLLSIALLLVFGAGIGRSKPLRPQGDQCFGLSADRLYAAQARPAAV